MEDIFNFTDDLGPEKIIHVYEPKLGLKGIVVVDNVSAGTSIGGIRMIPDISTEECFRLARAMTLKNAAAGLKHGGGKSMISGDSKMPLKEKEKLIRAFAQAIKNVVEYIPGPDMGTDEICMAWIKDEIGRSLGLPAGLGGIPLDEIGATGFGVSVSIDVAKDFCNLELKGSRAVIQGFGSVGIHSALFLAAKGVKIVGVSDTGGTLVDFDGINIESLVEFKNNGDSIIKYPKGEKRKVDDIIDIECDIWIPSARPDVVHMDNVDRLKTKLVAQGANIPITEDAEIVLHKKGILVLPDFIANAGGVICAAVEYSGGTQYDAFKVIEEKISKNTREVLKISNSENIPPRDVAKKLVYKRIHKMMSYRRTF
ncbi:MAG: Glu/Leu/Phe/Val dehydrogenase [Spirochaetota bacterium]|nr:Glu/Leu/Phe/Val dehydrogenase [Spirochaetota bacterium]